MRRIATGAGPVFALAALLLASLWLMSEATQGSARFGQMYSLLLAINAAGLVTLGGLIGLNLYRLLRQTRQRVAGARLTVRMEAMFVLLSVTPVLVVYYFSLQFLHRGIDSWFDVRIESALDDALELSRTSLGVHMRELLQSTETLGAELGPVSGGDAAVSLEEARDRSGATEISLLSANGRIIAASSADPGAIVPHQPDEAVLLQLSQSQSYVGLDPLPDVGLQIRVAVPLADPGAPGEERMLQALYPVPERMGDLADSVQSAYANYRELAYLRRPLKVSFTLTLSLVLLLSLLTAVWAAFFSARRLVAPLRDLVQGTRAVADGNYTTRLARSGQDEIGFLMESFNNMTRKLARADEETRRSQQRVEEHRTYLEAVLARLSSGVMTVDHEQRLVTANSAAGQILSVDASVELGRPLTAIGETYPQLRAFLDTLIGCIDQGEDDWRVDVPLMGPHGRQVLMCRGARLGGPEDPLPGHVVVFDDITALIQAERNAAWSEVARRLAHEIKNPLTPIQLSAERLRHKYLNKMAGDEAEMLDRLTRTIVQQVDAMKAMVNDFSNYARSPQMQPQAVNLNELVADVLVMYRGDERGSAVETDLDPVLPVMVADPARLRQVLHNLVKNALEASSAAGSRSGVVLETRCVNEASCSWIDLSVRDAGHGFPSDVLEHAFEPYVTTKTRGTGLGLAIVKKIVEEHGGAVRAENNADGGASVVIRFPVAGDQAAGASPSPAQREAV